MALLLVGVTYSFFNYTRTGGVNNLGTGNISFNAEYGTAINLTNIFPISSSDVNNANLTSTTIGITGSTNYSDGEEFLVSIVDVNNTVNGKKIPINYIATYEATTGNTIGTSTDNYFEVEKNSNIYKLTSTGSVVENKQVLVGFIKTEIGGTLTIKPYIDAARIAITDTPEENSEWVNGRTVFSTTEWNSLSTTPISFKLRTESNEGLWVEEPEPDNVLPGSCFTTRMADVYTVNSNMTQTELNDCISYINSKNVTFINNGTAEGFCLGTSRQQYGRTFQMDLDSDIVDGVGSYDEEYLLEHNIVIKEDGIEIDGYDTSCGSDIVVPNKVNYTVYEMNPNITSTDINNCVDYLTNTANWSVNTNQNETLTDFCSGTGTSWGDTMLETISYGYFNQSTISFLLNNNIIVEGNTLKKKVIYYNPHGLFTFQVNSIVLNKDLKIIGNDAFFGANITSNNLSIMVPNKVRHIGQGSFGNWSGSGSGNIYVQGKPLIKAYAIDDNLTLHYGGTCQELHDNSSGYAQNGEPNIIYGPWGDEFDAITTDSNTCKVYATTD
jgi:hypothetical protein